MPKDKDHRFILANPDEPSTGQYAFTLYEQAHPIRGDKNTIAHFKKLLAGLRGERVTLHFNGVVNDPETGERETRFRIQRTFNYRRYSDLFGAGSAYASAVHFVRDKYSDYQLVAMSMSLDIADEADEDTEEEI